MATTSVNKVDGPISQAEFARRRGVSRAAVSKAIKQGRLRLSVVTVGGRPKIVDVELANHEWDSTTDLSKAPTSVKLRSGKRAGSVPPSDFDLAAEAAREKHWKANLAELEYRVRAGDLVPVEEVEEKFVDAVTAAKTKLLVLSRTIQQRMPHIAAEDIRTIHELVREALEDLAYGR